MLLKMLLVLERCFAGPASTAARSHLHVVDRVIGSRVHCGAAIVPETDVAGSHAYHTRVLDVGLISFVVRLVCQAESLALHVSVSSKREEELLV